LKDSHLNNIINKCIKKDRSAQNELFRLFYSYGYSICARYVKNQLDTKSVVNEGFYKVLKNIKSYDQQYDFKPWFKTIMVHTCLDHIRKNEKLKYQVPIEEKLDVSIDPEAISKISFDEMIDIIGTLPRSYRLVFTLHVIDGYKHEEIASQLGITIGTSKSNLSRAKERLRSMLIDKIPVL